MFSPDSNRIVSSIILAVFLAGQILMISSFVLIPKPVKAVAGIGDTSITVVDIPAWYERLIVGIMRQIALNIANKFIARFVNKMVDKYKIKNFLYYDQVLTNFLLTNYIRDKIQDPDLRRIFELLNRGFITGEYTGTYGAPPRDRALIPQIKQAIYHQYLKEGGVPREMITDNSRNLSSREYFQTTRTYYLSPPSETERRLMGSFGAFQSNASTAAQLEVIVGNGIKAGRIIGGTCSFIGPREPGQDLNTPDACRAAGGTWQASALDQTRSFISNPTFYIRDHIDGFIRTHIEANFTPKDYWSVIGSLIGNFLWRQFSLNEASGSLSEGGAPYIPESDNELDIDNDGIPDGYDVNDNGLLDFCYHGGNPPNCTLSSAVQNSPYFIPLCQSTDRAITALQKYLAFVSSYSFEKRQSNTWLNRTIEASGMVDDLENTLDRYGLVQYDNALFYLGEYLKYLAKITKSLAKDNDLCDGLWCSDSTERQRLISNTLNMLNYLIAFKEAGLRDRCDNPNADAIAALPDPGIDPGDEEEGGGGFVDCDDPPNAISPDPSWLVWEVYNELSAEYPNFTLENHTHRYNFTHIVAYRLHTEVDSNWGRKARDGMAPISDDTLGYLRPDIGPGRFEAVDILGSGVNIQRGCFGLLEGQIWIDPTDPPPSYDFN
jgi:hypothetical protein